MSTTKESVEGCIPTGEHENNQEEVGAEHVDQNVRQVEGIWIYLNEGKNKNPFELLQTMKILQA